MNENIKVHMTRKKLHFKNKLILKAFQSIVEWRFSFLISFFVPEIFKFSYYANLVTDDVIGCSSTVVRHKFKNISANNEAMRNIRDALHFDVATATCSVPISFLFKIKYYHC